MRPDNMPWLSPNWTPCLKTDKRSYADKEKALFHALTRRSIKRKIRAKLGYSPAWLNDLDLAQLEHLFNQLEYPNHVFSKAPGNIRR